MNLELLRERKAHLEISSKNLADSWQVVQGQIVEVNNWITELEKPPVDKTKVDDPLAPNPEAPVE